MQQGTDVLKAELRLWSQLRQEQSGGAYESGEELSEEELRARIAQLKGSEAVDGNEPSEFAAVEKQCPFGATKKAPDHLAERLKGALAGRFAGCVLGVPVEGWQVQHMEALASRSGTPFPPTEYWHAVENPEGVQYGVDRRADYTLENLRFVPVDDDVTYTVLNLLLLKRYGARYTVEDAAELWKELLPYACTAEDSALKRLAKGARGKEAAEGNPYVEWIGAAIRGDAFGYACAGDPAAAARLSFNDAFLTHRRNGIYGEMFTAAAVAAAFTETTPLDAAKAAAQCIPRGCRLRQSLDWAFGYEGKLRDFREARALLDARFPGMNSVHTLNNMCAVVFALMLGGRDYTAAIANSVAMGLDNDCNGATVGSIVGANVGIKNIPEKWYAPFGDEVHTYLKGYETVSLGRLAADFELVYQKINGGGAICNTKKCGSSRSSRDSFA